MTSEERFKTNRQDAKSANSIRTRRLALFLPSIPEH
jgi:hypothetical protein